MFGYTEVRNAIEMYDREEVVEVLDAINTDYAKKFTLENLVDYKNNHSTEELVMALELETDLCQDDLHYNLRDKLDKVAFVKQTILPSVSEDEFNLIKSFLDYDSLLDEWFQDGFIGEGGYYIS